MKNRLLTIACSMLLAIAIPAGAADNGRLSNGSVKIGILTDMSGVYKTLSGPGSITAAKMAIEDFGGEVLGQPIALVTANHQNKPALASSITREWIDQKHVDAIIGLVTSSIGLAAQEVASAKNTITINVGAGT